NRGTTGAVVLRQPFGGMGKSAFGPGIKAGGTNYVAQLMQFESSEPVLEDVAIVNPRLAALHDDLTGNDKFITSRIDASERARICTAIRSYDQASVTEFGKKHDACRLIGQDNFRRYLPVKDVRIRIHPADSAFDVFARAAAAMAVGSRATISYVPGCAMPVLDVLEYVTDAWGARIEFVEESDDTLVQVIRARQTDRVRFAKDSAIPSKVYRAIDETGIYIARAPVLPHGRVELLWYVREQSISSDYHRYGTLAFRADEERSPTL
ncbi:MAG: proline dehydrogenase, partial [Gammaproteobacteria bacterium]|nr:proline dehydrogenase [Gammaproteobacteria bacterium]